MADYKTQAKIGSVIHAMTATAVTVSSSEYSGNANCTIINTQTSGGNAEGAEGLEVWAIVSAANASGSQISIYSERSDDGTNYGAKEFALTAKNNGEDITATGTYYCGRIYGLSAKMKLQARVETNDATVAIDAYPFYTQSATV